MIPRLQIYAFKIFELGVSPTSPADFGPECRLSAKGHIRERGPRLPLRLSFPEPMAYSASLDCSIAAGIFATDMSDRAT